MRHSYATDLPDERRGPLRNAQAAITTATLLRRRFIRTLRIRILKRCIRSFTAAGAGIGRP